MPKPGTDDDAKLLAEAVAAQTRAHAPYSRFFVGAAALCACGAVTPGCNVENASYGATICAERTAVAAAVARNHKRIKAVAVSGSALPTMPCGICRQFLAEFGAADPDFRIVLEDPQGRPLVFTIDELLPYRFALDPARRVDV